ncbi:methyltransferase TYW3-domain-containing protein [Gilbertella persicaria]|uniref:methyltransferase TYW3-domain-containing protein n=1 Tax=Gilbertella persicaria TaxID=101096 RepID=UPI002220C31A|nr:methyltransferase TYW3-domain-containing protein [Gilbertella persicaria]KAI8087837.1 methyltransferase TYW3-domain-containing protein [Gilbertella persicaria]
MSKQNSGFQTRKQQIVSSLVEYVDPERRDKSPKGFIDAPILDLMHVINQHPDYYTTSSCSGRVAVYCEGLEKDPEEQVDPNAITEKTTKGGTWLYVSHDPVPIPTTTDDWITQLLFGQPVKFNTEKPKDILKRQLIYFKFEPLILHVEASSQTTAMHLLSTAYQVGYQNSGITPSRRHMLAIRSTHKIDTPIAFIHNNEIHALVDSDYLLLLLTMANQKFEQNMARMKVFEETMKTELTKLDTKPVWEPKEERIQRMRQEGLAKRTEKKKKPSPALEDLLDQVVL